MEIASDFNTEMDTINKKEDIINKLKQLNIKYKLDEPLSRYTTLQIGGNGEFYIEPKTITELSSVLKLGFSNKLPIFIIGAGSNLLISDNGLKGFIIRLRGDFEKIEFDTSTDECIVGAGVMLPFLIKRTIDMCYSGFEPLAGIPGTVGGALVMNAGTKEGTISDNLVEVKTICMDGKVVSHTKQEIQFGYRKSSLEDKIIIEAKFKLRHKLKEEIIKQVTKNLTERAKTQPLGTLNAGSIFKNPENNFAGKLIEECNLKSFRIGGAIVSEKHANFILNTGNATSDDVFRLIFELRRRVYEKFKIKLELEIKLIGY